MRGVLCKIVVKGEYGHHNYLEWSCSYQSSVVNWRFQPGDQGAGIRISFQPGFEGGSGWGSEIVLTTRFYRSSLPINLALINNSILTPSGDPGVKIYPLSMDSGPLRGPLAESETLLIDPGQSVAHYP